MNDNKHEQQPLPEVIYQRLTELDAADVYVERAFAHILPQEALQGPQAPEQRIVDAVVTPIRPEPQERGKATSVEELSDLAKRLAA